MTTDVLYLRLVNGDQIVARYVTDLEGYLTVDFPMLIQHQSVEGMSAVNLVKYLPFTGHNAQTLILNKAHIVALSTVSTEFSKYFTNNWMYQETYVSPQAENNMSQINRSLETALSNETQAFAAAMVKHANQIPSIISNKVH